MQTTVDGEFIPSKELDKSFKIPKKVIGRHGCDAATSSSHEVLQGAYYDVTEMPLPPPPNVGQTPLPPFLPSKLMLEILENCEKPKTYANYVLKETIPDCFDPTLPKDLVQLFQPLYCKLCQTQLSSNSVARLHYKSKNHEKKIRKFLLDYSQKTGEPVHKRAKIVNGDGSTNSKRSNEEIANPLYFHCDVCDLPLTGQLHAESHYNGKNHRKAILGLKNPSGKGYRTPDGKWVRLIQSSTDDDDDDDDDVVRRGLSDDGFGRDFHTLIGPQPLQQKPSSSTTSSFLCDICNVTTTCKEQLASHYNGQKHQKMLKRLKLTPDSPVAISPHYDSLGVDSLKFNDSSIFRTPSGQYYCPTCNMTLNSEVHFKQHLQSKNHLKKAVSGGAMVAKK